MKRKFKKGDIVRPSAEGPANYRRHAGGGSEKPPQKKYFSMMTADSRGLVLRASAKRYKGKGDSEPTFQIFLLDAMACDGSWRARESNWVLATEEDSSEIQAG